MKKGVSFESRACVPHTSVNAGHLHTPLSPSHLLLLTTRASASSCSSLRPSLSFSRSRAESRAHFCRDVDSSERRARSLWRPRSRPPHRPPHLSLNYLLRGCEPLSGPDGDDRGPAARAGGEGAVSVRRPPPSRSHSPDPGSLACNPLSTTTTSQTSRLGIVQNLVAAQDEYIAELEVRSAVDRMRPAAAFRTPLDTPSLPGAPRGL